MNTKRNRNVKFKQNVYSQFRKDKKLDILQKELDDLKDKLNKIEVGKVSLQKFTDLPLSSKTFEGLSSASYVVPTEIQKEGLLLALKGEDILGAAKTGSGKTLAFLIPVMELLYKERWSQQDGMGALIIAPTRELAYQIFEVLRKVGKFHTFSAGLIIGGKDLQQEAERMNKTNIVICTPGRLLQHMDETPLFTADNLQILVLDEADRILDLGFQDTMNAIIENLPKKRQTLLYSATLSRSVQNLARLSLVNPMFVSVHEKAQHSTPVQLSQNYIVCDLHDKLMVLWSFIKNHLKKKTIVFMSTCKQVRFVYEAFCHLRPGVSLLALHGKMSQKKREKMYEGFCRKQFAVLFATDIAARGLDFPSVHWVVQFDCPDEPNTYIHRVGRTARYEKDGDTLMILLPSEEEGLVQQLLTRKIPIEKIQVNTKKMIEIQGKLQSMCAANVQLKEFAQKAFVSYFKFVYLMSNKEVFDVSKLDGESYARSLGLAVTPRIRFLKKALHNRQNQIKTQDSGATGADALVQKILAARNKDRTAVEDEDSEVEEEEKESEDEEEEVVEIGGGSGQLVDDAEGGSEDEELLTVKKKATIHDDDEEEGERVQRKPSVQVDSKSSKKVLTKAAVAKRTLKKILQPASKIKFDEHGEEIIDVYRTATVKGDSAGGIRIEEAIKRMREEDKFDKELHRQKVKAKHKEQRLKAKDRRRAVRLARQQEDDSDEDVDEQPKSDNDESGDEEMVGGEGQQSHNEEDESGEDEEGSGEETGEEDESAVSDEEGSEEDESGDENEDSDEEDSDKEEDSGDEGNRNEQPARKKRKFDVTTAAEMALKLLTGTR